MENRPKVNYGLLLDNKLRELEKSGERPKLLLHACCAPCSSHTLTVLDRYFRIVLFFCNPNIAPAEEFEFRLTELKRLVREMELDIPVIEEEYDPQPFYELARGLEDLPERGERCRRCIGFRLKKAGGKAKELGCDMFTTTLTISPHKDCAFINECGGRIQEECGVPYLFSDFKKHDGYKHSIELSRQYELYRQNYCGCIYSKAKAGGKEALSSAPKE